MIHRFVFQNQEWMLRSSKSSHDGTVEITLDAKDTKAAERPRASLQLLGLQAHHFRAKDKQSSRLVSGSYLVKEDRVYLHLNGHSYEFEILRKTDPSAKDSGEYTSAMPGKLLRIEVQEGEAVEEGQTLLVIEAMKMENRITARSAGRVSRIHVEEGKLIQADEVLLQMEQ